MFDFGDELTVESYRIPWLIWVQVLVIFLLILLLYCFTIISLDPTDSCSSSSSSQNTHIENKRFPKHSTASTVVTNRLQNTQVGANQSIKGEIAAGTSRRVVVRRGEEINADREDQYAAGINIYFHPCYYVRLARTAFLKCLGLDSASENSSNQQGKKKKEQ
ncbi:hypothetical protein L484_020070 [Morus notabilis]|uniref:Uncharacterized protein n=1 Tax=Morus notabilis TaxID=981085 RepID=W9RB47_9ROSA|nr:uncharacterized protein LOC21402982 [Morus notabilis]EXB80816.1 hypothetical protein L484_020070 [Morus notabilis]